MIRYQDLNFYTTIRYFENIAISISISISQYFQNM